MVTNWLAELDGRRVAVEVPASSAVLGDLVAIARELGSTWAGLPPAGSAAPAR